MSGREACSKHAAARASPAPPALAGHYAVVRRFLLRLVGDGPLAEDLAQETFARAEAARERFRKAASERTWLCSIALNLARDHFRAAARGPQTGTEALEHQPAEEDAEMKLLRAEMSTCIAEYLFRLPERQRRVVALHDMAEVPHREIAAALGITEANARVLLHRGRAALKGMLERDCILSFAGDPVPCERRSRASGSS